MNNSILAHPDNSLGSVLGGFDVAVHDLVSQNPAVEAASILLPTKTLFTGKMSEREQRDEKETRRESAPEGDPSPGLVPQASCQSL